MLCTAPTPTSPTASETGPSCCVTAPSDDIIADIPPIEHGTDIEVLERAEKASAKAPSRTATVAAATPAARITLPGLEDWAYFRLDRAAHESDIPPALNAKLENANCFYDTDIRGWACIEEIIVTDNATHRWACSPTGVYTPPTSTSRILAEANGRPDEPASIAVATQEHYTRLRQRVVALNRRIDNDYRERVRRELEAGTLTEADIINDSLADPVPEFPSPCRQQSQREDSARNTAETFDIQSNGPLHPLLPAEVKEDITVSTANGRRTPARLMRLGVRAPDGTVPVNVNIGMNIADSGSGAEIMGLALFEWLEWAMPPGSIRKVDKLPSSIDSVTGIGGVTPVLFHVALTLDIGGVPVNFTDIAVLPNHRGFLIGNDTLKQGRAVITYWEHTTADGSAADGHVQLCNKERTPISSRIPFTVTTTSDVICFSSQGHHVYSAETATGSTAEVEQSTAPAPSPSATSIAESTVPIAFVPVTTTCVQWAQQNIRVRVPKAATGGKNVLILPLEDERLEGLGVLVAPSISAIDSDGYTTVRVINPTQQPVTLALLTPIARFIVDPRISGNDLEFTTDEIIERVKVPDDLSEDERLHVRHMIAGRRRLFATTLGWAHGYKQHIDTPRIDSGEVPPPAFPMRNRSPAEWAALKESIDKQLKQRIIERCCSPYNAIPMPVKKPDGSYRVVIDYRALNNVTKRDVYPLPNVEANLAAFGKAKYWTVIDLLMGFHQCELTEESKLKTAFGTPWGQMCYTRMPMGLTSSPGAFMRLVDAAVRGLDPGIVWCYLDDLIVPTSGDFKHHIDTVGKVFDKLIEAGFTARCDKVQVALREVSYLGFLVGAYGTRPSPLKTAAIRGMQVQQLQTDKNAPARFAGMIGFYQRFIEDCAYYLAPFYDLRRNDADHRDITFSLRFIAAFEQLKHALANATALARPDYTKPFYIDVDAATVGGIGAVLSQRAVDDDPETHMPLGFLSRRFDSAERAYPIRDQECMGLVEAVIEWRCYILGFRTIVRTDHKSLAWLMKCQHPDGSRVAGWALRIQEYGVEIIHIAGKNNKAADCLSRAEIAVVADAGVEIHYPWARARHTDDTSTATHQHGCQPSGQGTGHSDDVTALLCALATTAYTTESETGSTVSGSLAEEPGAAPSSHSYITAASPKEHGLRLAIIVITPDCNVILERQGDILSLPSCRGSTSAGPVRTQLMRHFAFLCRAPERELLVRTLADPVRTHIVHPRAAHALTTYAVCWLPRSIPVEAFNKHSSITFEQAPFSVNLGSALNDDTDYNFVRHLYDTVDDRLARDARWIIRKDCIATLRAAIAEKNRGEKAMFKLHQQFVSAGLETGNCALTFNVSVLDSDSTGVVPNVFSVPDGPALCETMPEYWFAVARLFTRLRASSEPLISVDLEGELGGCRCHITLLQVSVDANNSSESQLTYVFNVNHRPQMLKERGEDSLRQILEDPRVTKIFHHCRGDVSSLYFQYGIVTRGIFDTAIADCLVKLRHHNSSRNLGIVLTEWLGLEVVHLSFKGKLIHTPRMFEVRPLPYHLFVYAYEDVTYGTQLYRAQRQALQRRGILELQTSLSALRAPPYSLPSSHKAFKPATHLAIAFTDNERVVCLQDLGDRVLRLPMCERSPHATSKATTNELKKEASEAWSLLMGKPSKGVRNAVNSRMHKPQRFVNGECDCLLFTAITPDCVARLEGLQLALTNSLTPRAGIVLRPRLASMASLVTEPAAGCMPAQAVLFQHLHNATLMMEDPCVGPVDDEFNMTPGQGPTLRVRLNLAIKDGQVTATTSTVLAQLPPPQLDEPLHQASQAAELGISEPTAPESEVCITIGKTVTDVQAALILHDEDGCAFAITRVIKERTTLEFPSAPVKVNESAAEAAVRAFDLYAGSALRKGCGGDKQGRLALFPVFGTAICKAFEALQPLGRFGNTEYFAAKLSGNAITWNASAFYAARSENQCFRLTTGQSKKHPSFKIIRLSDIVANPKGWFQTPDAGAVAAMSTATADTIDALAPPQPTAPDRHTDYDQQMEEDLRYLDITAAAVTANTDATTPETCNDPSARLGTDSEFDRLFEARVAVLFGELCESSAEAFPAEPVGLPTGDNCDAAGAPPKFKHVTRAQILEEQQHHPATAQFIDYLLTGDITPINNAHRAAFKRTADRHYIADDGVLMMSASKASEKDCIVLPPRFHQWCLNLYHDRSGHFGIPKTLALISRRYVWGTRDEMREDVSAYIKACHPCIRNKLPRHQTGAGQIADDGEYPNDVISADVYKTGRTAPSGADTIISFADHFSRAVYTRAHEGDPTSEEFAQILIEVIIAHYGMPRSIRTDHASVLISNALKHLYKDWGIHMDPSTAYLHRAIGLVERWHSVLKSLLLTHHAASKLDDWDRFLPLLQLAFNTAVSSSTGYSPFFVTHLREAVLPVDLLTLTRSKANTKRKLPAWVAAHLEALQVSYDIVARKLKINALNRKRAWDLKRDVLTRFVPGDRVLVIAGTIIDRKHPKAVEPAHGPYTILKMLPRDNYQIGDLQTRRIHDIMHVSRLLAYPSRRFFTDIEERQRYPVRAIVGHQILAVPADAKGERSFAAGQDLVEYRIRWRGLPRTLDTWRAARYLGDVFELVTAYRDSLAKRGLPLPPDTPPTLEEETSNDTASTDVSPFTFHRQHFRHIPKHEKASVPAVTEDEAQDQAAPAPAPAAPMPAVDDSIEYEGLDDVYPVGSKVRVRYADGWWPGTVERTYVSRPRKDATARERRIIVKYDNYDGLWEHGLRGTPVQLVSSDSTPHPSARVAKLEASPAARRAERISWALRPLQTAVRHCGAL